MLKIFAALLAVAVFAIAGCANSEETTTASHTAPRPTLSKSRAEAAFHRAVEEVAKGGLIKVGNPDTIETTCAPENGHWGCTAWFVAETGEYCLTVGAPVSNAGKVGKEHYGKLPLGEPGGPECKL